jgi:peptide/nickel transport system substrate-binding protein
MSRKSFLTITVFLATAMLLSACGQTATPIPVATATTAAVMATTAATAQAPVAAPTATAVPFKPVFLSVSMEQQSTWVRNFNPYSPDARIPAGQGFIYEPMMVFNKSSGELVPWLATGYTWSENDTVLTFNLRQGVQWSDGQPFTAQDVIFTFDLLKTHDALVNYMGGTLMNDEIASWTAPDDHTVVIKFKTVNVPSLYVISNTLIVPEHIWKAIDDPVTFTNPTPVGTGPFTEVTKFENQIFVLERNPHYWQEGKPYFQGVRFPAYPDNDSALLAMINGELDWSGNFYPDIEKTLISKDPKDLHYYFVGGDAVMLYINPALKPFDNPDVRKAVSMGIDRQQLVNVAMFDYVAPLTGAGLSDQYKQWINPAAVAAATWMNHDVQKANEILDSLGFAKGSDGVRRDKDGKKMSYPCSSPAGWTDWNSDCQIISNNMKDIGIEVTVDTPEENTWGDMVMKGQHKWSLGWPSGGADPYNYFRSQMSAKTVLPIGTPSNENWNRFVDPQADNLLDQYAKTADPAQQKDIMNQLQMLFVQDAPALPLYPQVDWYEYSTKNFTGWPDKDNPFVPGAPFDTPSFSPQALILITAIKPV